MAKTRIVNLAKELKIDVKELIQRLKDELGLQEHFTYLSSLDEATVTRVRQIISTVAPQMEELRVGENVKRRRRVAPVQVAAPEPVPEAEAAPPPEVSQEAAVKPSKPKEMARVVALPHKEKAPEEVPPPAVAEIAPAPVKKAKASKGSKAAAAAAPRCLPGGPQESGRGSGDRFRHRLEAPTRQGQKKGNSGPYHQPAPGGSYASLPAASL